MTHTQTPATSHHLLLQRLVTFETKLQKAENVATSEFPPKKISGTHCAGTEEIPEVSRMWYFPQEYMGILESLHDHRDFPCANRVNGIFSPIVSKVYFLENHLAVLSPGFYTVFGAARRCEKKLI